MMMRRGWWQVWQQWQEVDDNHNRLPTTTRGWQWWQEVDDDDDERSTMTGQWREVDNERSIKRGQ